MANFPDCILLFNQRSDSSITVVDDFAYIKSNFICSLMKRSRVTLRRRLREGKHPYLEFFGGCGYRFDLNYNLDPDPFFLLVKNQIKSKIDGRNYISLG